MILIATSEVVAMLGSAVRLPLLDRVSVVSAVLPDRVGRVVMPAEYCTTNVCKVASPPNEGSVVSRSLLLTLKYVKAVSPLSVGSDAMPVLSSKYRLFRLVFDGAVMVVSALHDLMYIVVNAVNALMSGMSVIKGKRPMSSVTNAVRPVNGGMDGTSGNPCSFMYVTALSVLNEGRVVTLLKPSKRTYVSAVFMLQSGISSTKGSVRWSIKPNAVLSLVSGSDVNDGQFWNSSLFSSALFAITGGVSIVALAKT